MEENRAFSTWQNISPERTAPYRKCSSAPEDDIPYSGKKTWATSVLFHAIEKGRKTSGFPARMRSSYCASTIRLLPAVVLPERRHGLLLPLPAGRVQQPHSVGTELLKYCFLKAMGMDFQKTG